MLQLMLTFSMHFKTLIIIVLCVSVYVCATRFGNICQLCTKLTEILKYAQFKSNLMKTLTCLHAIHYEFITIHRLSGNLFYNKLLPTTKTVFTVQSMPQEFP